MEDLIKKGFRTKSTSIYVPGSNKVFKISRSKLSSFIDCPRCFYLDRVKGLKEPLMPGWALNTAVDDLLKKEFDVHRKAKTPHPIMTKYNLNFVPFEHKDIDVWRNSLSGGISYEDKEVNLIIYGGVDDIWFNKDTNELVVVDYKAQSKTGNVETQAYLNDKYHQGYKRQMDIYVHILRQMGFKVSDTTYFMVCNGDKDYEKFDAKINFTITLVAYQSDCSWVPGKIKEMKNVLDSKVFPQHNINCEKCIYLESYAYLKDI